MPYPLFMAQGGPGGSTIDTYANALITSPRTRPVRNRDIVLWDQRGTYYSRPALLCPELIAQDVREAAPWLGVMNLWRGQSDTVRLIVHTAQRTAGWIRSNRTRAARDRAK
jgi:hypothetical protein